jgi:hypothetical protein
MNTANSDTGFWSAAVVCITKIEVKSTFSISTQNTGIISILIEASTEDEAREMAKTRGRETYKNPDEVYVIVEPISVKTIQYMAEVV